MKPESVNPRNFEVEEIIFDNGYFSIAYGVWENNTTHQLAMRWNGDSENEPGYPKLFNHPVWFLISEDLKKPILKSLLDLESSKSKELLKVIGQEFQ